MRPTALLLLLSLAASAHAAPITYTLVSYPLYQATEGPTYTLSGNIVTDGAMGDLQSSDITHFTYQITLGQITIEFVSTSTVLIQGWVQANPTQLVIPAANSATGSPFNGLVLPAFNGQACVEWYRSSVRDNPGDTYAAIAPNGSALWNAVTTTEPGLAMPLLGDGWVVATHAIPEPGSIVILAIGMVVAGLTWRRQ